MALEIERKFLLSSMNWKYSADAGELMIQGYLEGNGPTVRVRISDMSAMLTIKGKSNGLSRSEFEYPIPRSDAEAILAELCQPRVVRKIRYRIPAGNDLYWEIDEYLEKNAPLYTAEIELPTPDTTFAIPDWLGDEITHDVRFTNRHLSYFPYSRWGK